MVCGERGAHTGKPAAQAGRFLYRDAVTPSEDVPAHFVEAAGLETDCQRAVRVFREGLGGMEQECGCIAGYAGIEAQDRLDPWFLKHAKRTPRKAPQIERRVALERFVCSAGSTHVREPPKPRTIRPVRPRDQESPVSVEYAVGLDSLRATPSRRLGDVLEFHRASRLDGIAQH